MSALPEIANDIPPAPAAAEAGHLPADAKKRSRGFEVVDADALYAANPHLLKLVPDYRKIRSALKLGFVLPGVIITDGAPLEDSQESEFPDNTGYAGEYEEDEEGAGVA